MGYNSNDVEEFYRLFKSNGTAYGMTIIGEIVDGKAKSTSTLVHQPLSLTVISQHLEGKKSIGAAPLLQGDKVRWCAIDIDDASKPEIYTIIRAIEDFNLPLLPCLSKSQKLHIYCFFPEEEDAAEAIDLLRWYVMAFRRDNRTELFPKQTRMSTNNKFYSWINLPYFEANNKDNWRKNVIAEGEYRTVSEFITVARERQLPLKEHWSRLKELQFFSAPPCVLSGALLRDVGPGIRNQWFYNVACYLRMQDENVDLEEPLLSLNDTMDSPLPAREIRTTVAKVASKSYFYQCNGMLGCNKKACQTSTYGITNSSNSSGISYGTLTQVMTKPPYWLWEINGQQMRFETTAELLNQQSFREQAANMLHKVPHKVKEDRWTVILNRAMENLVIQEVTDNEAFNDFDKGALLAKGIARFFMNGRQRAYEPGQVLVLGRVYLNQEQQVFEFSASALSSYIIEKQQIRVTPTQLRMEIVDWGAYKEGAVWKIPVDKIPALPMNDVEIDYHDKEGMENGTYNF